MKARQAILLGIALTVLMGAGFMAWRDRRTRVMENADFPSGITWLCTDPGCKAEFVLSLEAMSALAMKNPEATPRCPRCGSSDVVRAVRCERCKRLFPRGLADRRGAAVCPGCRGSSSRPSG